MHCIYAYHLGRWWLMDQLVDYEVEPEAGVMVVKLEDGGCWSCPEDARILT